MNFARQKNPYFDLKITETLLLRCNTQWLLDCIPSYSTYTRGKYSCHLKTTTLGFSIDQVEGSVSTERLENDWPVLALHLRPETDMEKLSDTAKNTSKFSVSFALLLHTSFHSVAVGVHMRADGLAQPTNKSEIKSILSNLVRNPGNFC